MGKAINIIQQSDEELMELVNAGKKSAFSEVYQRYHGKMLNYFYRMLYQDEEKARDFAHDLFVKIMETPTRFDTQKRFSTWIYAVASNMCKNEYRSRAVRDNGIDPHSPLIQDEEKEIAGQLIDSTLFRQKLQHEIQALNPKQKEAFVLRFQNEMPIKEIAETMECSEGTIKSRLFYSLKRMSEKLKEFNPNG